jgi:hypothetical protein
MKSGHLILAVLVASCASSGVLGCFAVADLDRFHEQDAESADTAGPSSDAEAASDATQEGGPGKEASAGVDASQTDATVAETSTADASSGAFYAIDDATRWTFFDVKNVGGATTYSGVVFDGRYLYFVPNFSPPNVLRYDTHAALNDISAWTFFAPMAAIQAAGGSNTGSYTYLGGGFDGRYVYLAPFGANTYAIQYDTQQPFAGNASWSAFQTTTMDPKANYWGVASDGRYAYFMPNTTTTVLAYDNTAATDSGTGFASASSWTAYNLGTGANYGGFWGGVFADSHLYLVPYSTNVASSHDTTLPVTSPAAWDVGVNGFDFSNNEQLSPPHFWGGAYDGSHVYLLPYKSASWTIAAYSTSGGFTDDGVWSTCALETQLFAGAGSAAGFVGGAFDGKRLILAPFGQLTASDGGTASLPVVAYDTTQPLCPANVTSAYTQFDPTTLEGGATAQGFEGAAFDGQYVYLVPHVGSVVARFQAKTANTGLTPSVYRGSWW